MNRDGFLVFLWKLAKAMTLYNAQQMTTDLEFKPATRVEKVSDLHNDQLLLAQPAMPSRHARTKRPRL